MESAPSDSGQRTRIVFVIDSLTAGGTERHLLRLAAGLVRSGRWEVSVYCLTRTGSFVPAMEGLGVEVAGPTEPMSWSPRRLIPGLIRLYRHLRRERPAIAHCYLAAGGLLGGMVARLVGVPVVITTRRTVFTHTDRKQRIHRAMMQLTARFSDAVIAVCEAARRQGIEDGASPGKIVTIYNSMPERPAVLAPRRCATAGPVIGTLGRLHEQKGQMDLVEAARLVQRRLPNARFMIAGDGPAKTVLRERVAELGLEDRVELLGEQLDTESVLAGLDIFVLPSLAEGMPNALIEAMAAGLPVVATRVGGIPEVVLDGETGILVEPQAPPQLADAIVRLWDDPALRRRYGEAGQRFVGERFGDAEREVDETEAVYRRLLPWLRACGAPTWKGGRTDARQSHPLQ